MRVWPSVSSEIRAESKDVKVALATVAPTSRRAKRGREYLAGKRIDEELIEKAAQTASHELTQRHGVRSSAEYNGKGSGSKGN